MFIILAFAGGDVFKDKVLEVEQYHFENHL